MAVPRSRVSNQRKNTRRAHHAKKPKNAIACSNCGSQRLSHRICPSCGYYNNRSVMKKEED
ncbi:MAG: 50S ribosomal protein L32 [Chlamydiales bacterium]|nr:50S ribosomal protein L32 [Chlamydiales bacterium]